MRNEERKSMPRNIFFGDLMGNADIESIKLKINNFNAASSEEIQTTLLSKLFGCKLITKITLGEHECIGQDAYVADQRAAQFSKNAISHYIGEISGDFSNIVFGPGPQPPKRHDHHVWLWRMLQAPRLYKLKFPIKPKILAKLPRFKESLPPQIKLLHEKFEPLPGMCECTAQWQWKTFYSIPVSDIAKIELEEISTTSYKLKIHLKECNA